MTIRSVAIVGGGPAGAQCARSLAERGVAVTLFEPRERFEKPCGGGVPARGLECYPFLDDPRLPRRVIGRCLLVSPAGREATIPLADPLWIFARADLHRYLLERAASAGCRLVRARVADFARHADGRWTLEAAGNDGPRQPFGGFDFLVAADGAAGAARRRLGRAIPAAGLTQGIGYYLPGLSEEFITLKFYRRLHGYLWVFPRPDHSSAGICATLGEAPAAALRALMDGFLETRYGRALLERSGRYAALIPGAPADPAPGDLQGEGWAFAGDTGRFVDPLTREGIYYAMRTGEILAGRLAAGRPEEYAAAWAREGGGEMAWASRHAAGFFDARFVERVVGLTALSPAVGRVLAELIAGRQPYRSLKRRLLLLGPRIGFEVVRTLAARPAAGLRPARGS
jgi:flavin-dependent dehydrogenase